MGQIPHMEKELVKVPAPLKFYQGVLKLLNQREIPFLLGGGYAMYHYTGIERDLKDMDVFCKSSDYIHILKLFDQKGYQTQATDARWLGKIFKNDQYVDIIFDTVNNICRVDDSWFKRSSKGEVLGLPVRFLAAEDLAWCKIYVQNRERFDGADLNHIFLKQGKKLDWKWLLMRLDQHWHLLLSQVINFQFVYPAERDIIPRWLFDELISRAKEQYDLDAPIEKVCRGPIIDQTQYQTDIKDWDYKVVTIKTV